MVAVYILTLETGTYSAYNLTVLGVFSTPDVAKQLLEPLAHSITLYPIRKEVPWRDWQWVENEWQRVPVGPTHDDPVYTIREFTVNALPHKDE